MITSGDPLEDEPLPEPTGEPNAYPSAGYRAGILLSRHRIVEGMVQVAERHVHSHPGDRQLRLARFRHTRS